MLCLPFHASFKFRVSRAWLLDSGLHKAFPPGPEAGSEPVRGVLSRAGSRESVDRNPYVMPINDLVG